MSTGLNLSDRVYHYDTNPAIRAELPTCASSRNQYGTPIETLHFSISNGEELKVKLYEDVAIATFRGIRFVIHNSAYSQFDTEKLSSTDPLALFLELNRLSQIEP